MIVDKVLCIWEHILGSQNTTDEQSRNDPQKTRLYYTTALRKTLELSQTLQIIPGILYTSTDGTSTLDPQLRHLSDFFSPEGSLLEIQSEVAGSIDQFGSSGSQFEGFYDFQLNEGMEMRSSIPGLTI